MKNVVYKLFVTVGLALGLTAFNANAALMGMSGGYWSNPNTGGDLGTAATVQGEGTNVISWGSGGYGQSSWTFYGLDFEADTNGDWFKIGVFKHYNKPIYNYNFLGADLVLDLAIGDGSWKHPLTFWHEETLNWGETCEYGTNPCADKVTLPYLTSTDTITIDGMEYELTIKGYTRSGGFTDTLWTYEKDKKYAKLYAHLHKVPEPSIIALFGIGLLGLGFASRRKAKG